MDDFAGYEFYDYYESVTLICRWPGCKWSHPSGWAKKMHEPFVAHFRACHMEVVNEPQS